MEKQVEQEVIASPSFWRKIRNLYWYHSLSYRLGWYRLKDRAALFIVWRLPKWIIEWSVIRMWSHGTTGIHGNTSPNDLTWNEAHKRWRKPNE